MYSCFERGVSLDRPRPGSDATLGETDHAKLAHAGLAFEPGYNAYHLAEKYAATHDGTQCPPPHTHPSLLRQFPC